jgi:hypothetical protein
VKVAPLEVRWRSAVRDSNLHPAAKHVALILATYWNGQGTCAPWGGVSAPGAGPSVASMANQTGRKPVSVRTALTTLEREGWIERTHTGHGRGNTHRWIAAFPGGVDAPRPATRAAHKWEAWNEGVPT